MLIVEGLNVLQPARMPKGGEAIPFVSDFFNFSIYMDADVQLIEDWYVTRFMRLRQTAFRDPAAYFHRYAHLSPDEARAQGARDLAHHQREEPLREHPAHATARPPHPAQGPQPQHRERGPAADLMASSPATVSLMHAEHVPRRDRCSTRSQGLRYPSSPFVRASSRSDTSGRAPMWEMISAAARLPSRPAVSRSRPVATP